MITTSMTSGILRFETGEIGLPMIEQATHATAGKCTMPRPDLRASVRPSVAKPTRWRYRLPVTVNPVAGFGDPSRKGAQAPTIRKQALFLCPQFRVMAAVRGRPSGLPGSFSPVRQPAHSCHPNRLATIRGSSTRKGAVPMKHDPARNPSALQDRAAAHRAMAMAALRADSSLSVRLKRYNHHMTIARSLEATAERDSTTSTRDPRAALAWLQSGRPVRIDSLNLHDHLRHVRALAALEARGGAK